MNEEFEGTEIVKTAIRAFAIFIIIILIISIKSNKSTQSEKVKQLEQSLSEQVQECEVYRNRCKILEDRLIEEGLVVDNCECN